MTRQINQDCLTAHLAAEARHEMAATLSTLHPDCVFLDQPLGLRFDGRDGARRHYELWWSAFGVTLDGGRLHWVADDLVIGETAFVGTHVGLFAGIEPTGRDIRLPFVVFVEFRDGLLVGERFMYDLNGLLLQLRHPAFVPTFATPPEGTGG